MTVGIGAVTYQQLVRATRMGFEHIQLGFLPAPELAEAARLRKRCGFTVHVHSPLPMDAPLPGRETLDLASMDPGLTEQTKRVLLESLDSASLLEAPSILVHYPSAWRSGHPSDYDQALRTGVERISWLCDQASPRGINVLVENAGPSPCFYEGRHYAELLEGVGRENLGMCLDIGHLQLMVLGRGLSMERFVHDIRPYVRQLHAWNTRSWGEFAQNRIHHLPLPEQAPRDGWIDIPVLAQLLHQAPVEQVIIEGSFMAARNTNLSLIPWTRKIHAAG